MKHAFHKALIFSFLLLTLLPLPSSGETMKNIYSFTMKTIDGQDKSLADYQGKTLLVVNTASLCGHTPQYKTLQALYDKYKTQGLEILAFPANNFGAQEPGTDQEIKTFCSTKFNVTFPVFSKISVKGADIHPLYQYLTTESGFPGDIKWNFNKFLIDPSGKVVARFESGADPMSAEVVGEVERLVGMGHASHSKN